MREEKSKRRKVDLERRKKPLKIFEKVELQAEYQNGGHKFLGKIRVGENNFIDWFFILRTKIEEAVLHLLQVVQHLLMSVQHVF